MNPVDKISFKCSAAQEDLLFEYAVRGGAVVIHGSEHRLIRLKAQELAPGREIQAADLDVDAGIWTVTFK